ncbi:MAG: M23 family metallopeptidase, partial [Hypericibacter sp.]
DFLSELGAPVMATAPGKVVFAGWKGDYGKMVEIDHGLGIHTRYGHLKSITVKVGDEVTYRQQIGALGNTGRSTGPHVHYEVRVDDKAYDPMNFLEAGRYVFKG